jgi:hypothetical protein
MFWAFDDNERFWNLVASLISYTLFSVGVGRALGSNKIFVLVIFTSYFIFYQYYSFKYFTTNFVSKLELPQKKGLVLLRNGWGATTLDAGELLCYERYLLIFNTTKTYYRINRFKEGEIFVIDDNTFGVRYLNYENSSATLTFKEKDLFNGNSRFRK